MLKFHEIFIKTKALMKSLREQVRDGLNISKCRVGRSFAATHHSLIKLMSSYFLLMAWIWWVQRSSTHPTFLIGAVKELVTKWRENIWNEWWVSAKLLPTLHLRIDRI